MQSKKSNPMDVGAAKAIGLVVLDCLNLFGLWFLTAVQCRDSDIMMIVVECSAENKTK